MLKRKIKEKIFNLKMMYQRAKKGYCDLDVWNIDMFIEDKLLNILKEFRKDHVGYPYKITSEEWDKTLDRMIFLLFEMNGEKYNNSDMDILEICAYRKKCKDEFYDLLKEYHWDLWS